MNKTFDFRDSKKTHLKSLVIFSIGLILVLSSHPLSAQMEPFLLLEKPGTKHRIRYYVGDEILFKHKDQEMFNTATVVGFSDTSFFVNKDVEIKIREVEAVADRSKVKAVRGIAKGAFIAIPGFFLLTIANNGLNTGERPLVGREVYPLVSAFAVLGGLGYLYKGKRYRLENRWRLIVVHH